MILKLTEGGRNIPILFNLGTERKDTNGKLSIYLDNAIEAIVSVPNDVVINLIHHLKKNDSKLRFEYESQTPYWFFHDLAHALYTPDLFIPEITEISREREEQAYIEGIRLARDSQLPKEYITSVSEIKAFV